MEEKHIFYIWLSLSRLLILDSSHAWKTMGHFPRLGRPTCNWSWHHSPSCVRKFPIIVSRRQTFENHPAGNEWFHINGHLSCSPHCHKISCNDGISYSASSLPEKSWILSKEEIGNWGFTFFLKKRFSPCLWKIILAINDA